MCPTTPRISESAASTAGPRLRDVATRQRGLKLLGVAGLVGIAATGALIARDERERRAYTPDEVRSRLRDRAAQAAKDGDRPDQER